MADNSNSNNDTKQHALDVTYGYFSTARHAAFSLENMLGSYEGDDGLDWVDPLNPVILEFLRLPRVNQMVYDNAIPITTNSYNTYGNTSLWWLILCCSDFIHAHQIPSGEIINIPSVAAITALINSPISKGQQGQVIII